MNAIAGFVAPSAVLSTPTIGGFSANPAVGLMRGIGLQSVAYLPFSLGSP